MDHNQFVKGLVEHAKREGNHEQQKNDTIEVDKDDIKHIDYNLRELDEDLRMLLGELRQIDSPEVQELLDHYQLRINDLLEESQGIVNKPAGIIRDEEEKEAEENRKKSKETFGEPII